MIFDIPGLNHKVNTLENENDILREIIKNELYKDFIKSFGEQDTIKKLKEENKRLRLKVKELQQIISDSGRTIKDKR